MYNVNLLHDFLTLMILVFHEGGVIFLIKSHQYLTLSTELARTLMGLHPVYKESLSNVALYSDLNDP